MYVCVKLYGYPTKYMTVHKNSVKVVFDVDVLVQVWYFWCFYDKHIQANVLLGDV